MVGLIQEKHDLSTESVDPSFCSGAAVQQRTDWCPIQAVKPRHHFWPLFLYKSWGRCCSPWGLPDCGSHLPQSHLGNFLWGLAANCHRTAWTTYVDLQVKLASVLTHKILIYSANLKKELGLKSARSITNQNTTFHCTYRTYFRILQLSHLVSKVSLQLVFVFSFRGCVIGPTFHFNVLDLNFGDVGFGKLLICLIILCGLIFLSCYITYIYCTSSTSASSLCSHLFHICHLNFFSFWPTSFLSLSTCAGFPKTLTCSLFNTSCVPMTFALRVLGDGLGSPSVSYDKQLFDMSRNNWQASAARDLHARPVEFTISPAAGSVPSMSDVTIEVQ